MAALKEEIVETFPSMEKFLQVIRKREINPIFFERKERLQDVSKEDTAKDFYFAGTKNYKESESLARKGWIPDNSIFRQAKSSILNANAATEKIKREAKVGVIGYTPHVPNFLQGRPDSMIYTQIRHTKTNKKTLKLCFNITSSCNMDVEKITKCADLLFKIINSSDYDLHVVVMCGVAVNLQQRREQKICCFVDLKKATLQQIYFAIVNPSMLRRLVFRWFETNPERITKKFIKNYGHILPQVGDLTKKAGYGDFKIISLSDLIYLNENNILEFLKAKN